MIKNATIATAVLCCGSGLLVTQVPAVADPIANAGTLTCTLSPATKDSAANMVVSDASCRFKALVGPGADFEGKLTRKPVANERTSKIVVMWSVVASKPDVSLKELEGQYVGQVMTPDRDTSATGLVGGRDNSIALRPLNADPKSLPPAGISTLSLKLTDIKT